MKKELHPQYNDVIFFDSAADYKFLTKSTLTSEETMKWEDGNEYPVIRIEVSSASHPFYTGKQNIVDKAGRVDRFKARMEKSAQVSTERKGKKAKNAARKAKQEEAAK